MSGPTHGGGESYHPRWENDNLQKFPSVCAILHAVQIEIQELNLNIAMLLQLVLQSLALG